MTLFPKNSTLPFWLAQNRKIGLSFFLCLTLLIGLSKADENDSLDSTYQLALKYVSDSAQSPTAHFLLGKTSLQGKESFLSFKHALLLGLKGEPQEEALFYMAQFYYSKGSYGMAISFYRQVIQGFPQGRFYHSACYWMGHACLNYRKSNITYVDSAKSYFLRLTTLPIESIESIDSIKSSPYYSQGQEGLARTFYLQNNLRSAKESALEALKFTNKNQQSLILYYLYEIALKTQDTLASQAALTKLFQNYPQSMESRLLHKDKPANLSPPPQIEGTHSYFYLQLGVFASQQNAIHLQEKLKKEKVTTLIKESTKGIAKVFIVQSKLFSSKKAAESFGIKKLKTLSIPYYLIQKN